ncbi:hypothetical protein CS006_03840 [Bifidobacterium primatium]|uniref:DUF881 domain-containing protein n=1 Tax=Bifidobacterium primatium TaxID=2045438 RepID=A0A2M9HBR1_9BIFI|nr:DUF881 domain-containing protein [Bifidobacterium primatium]PJM74256.1 hypothetical protein CS006_03840 [Bifidobacterium primatium]
MGKHGGRHVARKSIAGSLVVAVILALAGYLLTVNVRVNRSVTVNSDTSQLLNERSKHVNQLQSEIDGLSTQIDALKALTTSSSVPKGEDAGSGTKLPAVHGPGLTVTLDDSPLWQSKVGDTGSSADINDYVVHQQDIEGVVNALWAGGAETMMIEDQRVLYSSAVRCVGNVLLLQGKRYAPPFRISAIGPQEDMVRALDDSPTVQVYKEYVASIGLGWKMERVDDLRFPATTSSLQALKYAKVKKEQ